MEEIRAIRGLLEQIAEALKAQARTAQDTAKAAVLEPPLMR